MEVYVGLDVSDKSTHLCVVDGSGATVWSGACATDPEVIAKPKSSGDTLLNPQIAARYGLSKVSPYPVPAPSRLTTSARSAADRSMRAASAYFSRA